MTAEEKDFSKGCIRNNIETCDCDPNIGCKATEYQLNKRLAEIAELDEQLQLQHDHIKELKAEIERLKQDASHQEVKFFELEKQFRNGC